jgi:hypothetical protein
VPHHPRAPRPDRRKGQWIVDRYLLVFAGTADSAVATSSAT